MSPTGIPASWTMCYKWLSLAHLQTLRSWIHLHSYLHTPNHHAYHHSQHYYFQHVHSYHQLRQTFHSEVYNSPWSKTILKFSTLLLCLSTLTTLSTHFSAINIPIPSDLSSPRIQNSIYLWPLLHRTCNRYLSIVFLECMPRQQCLYYFTCSTCQWVNIPGTDPKLPAFP